MERSSEPNNSMPRLALRFVAGTVGLSRLAEWMAAWVGRLTDLLWEWRPQRRLLGVPATSYPIGASVDCGSLRLPTSFLLGDNAGVSPSWKKVLLRGVAA
jgi:hypothetical protein